MPTLWHSAQIVLDAISLFVDHPGEAQRVIAAGRMAPKVEALGDAMKAVFVLFDSLNRLGIGAYGGTIGTPNIDRFARRAVTFDTHYVGSLPC